LQASYSLRPPGQAAQKKGKHTQEVACPAPPTELPEEKYEEGQYIDYQDAKGPEGEASHSAKNGPAPGAVGVLPQKAVSQVEEDAAQANDDGIQDGWRCPGANE
jgi:hypothetical protein